MLWAFKLDTRIKAQIDKDLPGLLNEAHSLSRYGLSDAQISAIGHVLGRGGDPHLDRAPRQFKS
jgi:hypothetical protein